MIENSCSNREETFHDNLAVAINADEVMVDENFEACTAPENRLILKRIGDIRNKKILELGCGSGEASVYFAKHGADVSAADISGMMLKIAERIAERHGVFLNIKKSDSQKLDFRDGIFDIVYAANLLHHVDIDKTLSEVHRVLKPGGIFASWDPLAYNPVINIYRSIANEVRTKDEHPLKLSDLKIFRKYFSHVEIDAAWFFTLLLFVKYYLIDRLDPNRVRYWEKILKDHKKVGKFYRALEILDKMFLRLCPFMKRYCWNVIVFCRKDQSNNIETLAETKIYCSSEPRTYLNFAIGRQNHIKKILIVNLGGIGDILLSTPALKALKSHYPGSLLSILIFSSVSELANTQPFLDEVFILYTGCGPVALFRNLRTILALRKKRFDLAVNMRTILSKRSASRLKRLFSIIRPALTAGRNTDGRGEFFDISIPETTIGNKHEAAYDIDTIEMLNADVYDRKIDFYIDRDSLKRIDKILEKNGVSERDVFIGIHPGGKPSHRWPIENFYEVLETIRDKIDHKVFFVVTGTREETRLAEGLIRMAGKRLTILNSMGKFNIRELAALIKRCRLYIANDSAPMHIAAALKTPLIAIFGPGYIERFDPRAIFAQAIVFRKETDCSPCDRERCKSIKCLKAISPAEVIPAALKLLNEKIGVGQVFPRQARDGSRDGERSRTKTCPTT